MSSTSTCWCEVCPLSSPSAFFLAKELSFPEISLHSCPSYTPMLVVVVFCFGICTRYSGCQHVLLVVNTTLYCWLAGPTEKDLSCIHPSIHSLSPLHHHHHQHHHHPTLIIRQAVKSLSVAYILTFYKAMKKFKLKKKKRKKKRELYILRLARGCYSYQLQPNKPKG